MRSLAIAVLIGGAAVGACREQPRPAPRQAVEPSPAVSPKRPAAIAPATAPSTVLAVPSAFTALGTEPFWAAKVAGDRLTYTTPEDQAGQAIAVARTASAQSVELRGTLGGKPLALRVSVGPCSDGMSDTVYRFSVVRTLGDDEQRGCARPD